MPRYYFHIRDCEHFIRDDEGSELRDAEHARSEAIKDIQDLIAQNLRSGFPISGLKVEIEDETGPVGAVAFNDVVDRPHGPLLATG